MPNENNEFTQIMKKPNGAKFHWADLHIHTPAWNDFKLPSGVNLNDEYIKKEFAKKYIEQSKSKNITILGITEHNDISLTGISIHYNDNLNCIIGGKGTGKSTIIMLTHNNRNSSLCF